MSHPYFGEGAVASVLDGGRLLKVIFDRLPGVPYTLPREQFRFEGAAPDLSWMRRKESGEPRDVPSLRQTVEAMRMGVVPPSGIGAFTVGRDRELRRIEALTAARRGLLLVMGHYGSGKTHLLELGEEMALASRLLTSRVTFDPVEVPPSHPARVYREIVSRLRYPDHPGSGLRPLLERLRASSDHGPYAAYGHLYLSAALHAHCKVDPDVADEVIDFVSGCGDRNADEANRLLRHYRYAGPRLLALPDYRTFGQVYAYILGGIATWARAAGYAGLLVLLDEAEYLDDLSTTSRQMAETFLSYLAVATLPDDKLAFDRAGLYRGGHESHRRIPERYREDQPLSAMFAFTPLPEVNRAINAALRGRSLVMEIEPIEPDLVPRLVDRVIDLYRALHPAFKPPSSAGTDLKRHISLHPPASTREAVRTAVEVLDLFRLTPARAREALATSSA